MKINLFLLTPFTLLLLQNARARTPRCMRVRAGGGSRSSGQKPRSARRGSRTQTRSRRFRSFSPHGKRLRSSVPRPPGGSGRPEEPDGASGDHPRSFLPFFLLLLSPLPAARRRQEAPGGFERIRHVKENVWKLLFD